MCFHFRAITVLTNSKFPRYGISTRGRSVSSGCYITCTTFQKVLALMHSFRVARCAVVSRALSPFYLTLAYLLVSLPGCDSSSDPGTGSPGASNRPPSVQSLVASVPDVAVLGSCSLRCTASDPDDDALIYTWSVSAGTIIGHSPSAIWSAPNLATITTARVIVSDGRGGSDCASLTLRSHRNPANRVLIDASNDGGVFWFPQWEGTGFDPNAPHQGKALADYIRSRGFDVYALPRTQRATDSLLNQYDKVIIANSFSPSESDAEKYMQFIERPTSLVLIGEFLRPGWRNLLAEHLGIRLIGIANGTVTRFAPHAITAGARPFSYIAGSVVVDTTSNPSIEFLGWLSNNDYVDLNDNGVRDPIEPTGMPVMGILHHPKSKIFFLGDLNGLEGVPQPLTGNLVTWAFQ